MAESTQEATLVQQTDVNTDTVQVDSAQEEAVKTFSQDDVNKLIEDRLSRERRKFEKKKKSL